ncbi:ATP-dependent helicase/deoxyribonuclease subunit B [Ferrovum sp. JA12]|uniref:PD-(D/E)XK nuclease family protein n=1 Tax=Ferrovum sp. JA12 TaxID=1356299 RepID=UPI000713A4AD|nr:PD-(D/E)XK nuclease family protein [Ferrovum sp. JA12]KRH79901.1 ATP-dependent helicase/deoxyribonuclease subunit B [Ferrovum sp. JA12]
MERREGKTRVSGEVERQSWALQEMVHEVQHLIKDYPSGKGILIIVPHAKLISQLGPLIATLAPRAHITTFSILAERVPLKARIMGEFERQQLIYDALNEHQWFNARYRWNFAEEAVKLMDELSLHGIVWPHDEKSLVQILASAYQSALSQPLVFEAKVVYTLWQLLHSSHECLSVAMAYIERLQRLPQFIGEDAIIVMEASLHYPSEKYCIEELSQQKPVKRIPIINTSPSDFREWLYHLWMPEQPLNLVEWIHRYEARFRLSPITGRIKIAAYNHFEEEVQYALNWIAEKIASQQIPIMVVAQDRQAARRLQACLSSKGISVEDGTGWVLSTTTVVAGVHVCLSLIQQGITRQGLFELFHLPWFLSALAEPERDVLLEQLKNTIGQFAHLSQLNKWLNQRSLDEEIGQVLGEEQVKAILLRGLSLFQQTQASLSDWIHKLFELLELWLMLEAIQQDHAGRQLMDLLQQLAANQQHQQGSYTFNEWFKWLERILEMNHYQPDSQQAQVVFTQLSQCLYIPSKATLVLGADNSQLPYIPNNILFSDAVRSLFQLPIRENFIHQAILDLLELFDHSDSIIVMYRTENGGIKTTLSPMLDILENTHLSMYHESLMLCNTAQHTTPYFKTIERPSVVIPPQRLPKTLTASFYQRILNCPYQSFIYDVLGLKKSFPVKEEVTKAEFGQLVHQILSLSVETKRRQSQYSWLQSIQENTDKLWQRVLEQDPYWRAWLVYWNSLIPAVSQWFEKRELEHWKIQGSEQWFKKIKTKDHQSTEVAGSIDRWDARMKEDTLLVEILDYKLKNSKQISKKDIELGEEIQLPLYAQLMDEYEVNASYVFLEDDPVKEVTVNHLGELSQQIIDRWFTILQDTQDGMGWPAHAETTICQRCQYQGLCRKQFWQ